MTSWVRKSRVGWVAAALVLGASLTACGSEGDKSPPIVEATGGSDDGASPVGVGGEHTDSPDVGEGGSDSPTTPGELVCSKDDDCTTREKPVCDQVQGCVACQYDWDCPKNHRCNDNQCFEKQACATNTDCSKDAAHSVCDAVQQLCVACRENADCGDGKRCEASECVTFEACTNSRDCTGGKVCSRDVGACVTCVVDGDCGDGSACVQNACVPTCKTDKECLGIGKLCDQHVGRCVECLAHQDCPTQYFCAADGHCSLDVCEKDQARCNGDHSLGTCSAVGDAFVDTTCAADTLCVEDGTTASCTPLACAPGGSVCAEKGDVVEHCSEDGLSVESKEPCGKGQVCAQGACVDVVCAPGTASCDGKKLSVCNESGTAQPVTVTCSNYEVCDVDTASCKPRACSPQAAVCDGNVATHCALDGSGPSKNDGQDCAADGRACYDGACYPVVCTDPYVCEDGILKKCSYNGIELETVSNCKFQALCDAVAGKCITPTCTPGAFTCDGNVATRCKADGSGYAEGGTDCSKSNEVCDSGGCLAKSCTAGSTFCQGGNPQKCSPSGATYEPTDVCYGYEYCSATSSTCLEDKCTADAAVCNGNVATKCASDGSGPVAGGTDCAATGKVCQDGACLAVVCTAGAKTCQGEAVYTCNANGTGTTLYDSCSLNEYCNAAQTPVCAPDICTAGSLGCNGEVISTCGSNGGSWTNPGTNCKATNKVCILGGTCAAEEVATQGSTTYSTRTASNTTILSAFQALTSRKLTKLETYASFNGLQKVTWVVYEKRNNTEAYDLVYQKVTAQTMPTLGFLTSPALDLTLKEGKTYAVGVHIAGSAAVAYTYSSIPAKASFMTGSFAAVVSDVSQPSSSITAYSDYYYRYLRITTAVAP